MTREKAKELLPIINAFIEGKTIEFRNKKFNNDVWYANTDNPNLGFEDSYEYRIKPEPTYRPWTAEDVIFGTQLTNVTAMRDGTKYLLVECTPHGVRICHRGTLIDWSELLKYWKFSVDNGKTWERCGVLI